MGALKGEKGSLELTDIGYILGQLPVHPSVGLLAYFGFPFRMLEESIITASILATKSPIIAVAQRGIESFLQRLRYSDGSDSDVLAGVRAYYFWKEQRGALQLSGEAEVQWCQRQFLSLFTLSKKPPSRYLFPPCC